jgi:hypothetical protein
VSSPAGDEVAAGLATVDVLITLGDAPAAAPAVLAAGGFDTVLAAYYVAARMPGAAGGADNLRRLLGAAIRLAGGGAGGDPADDASAARRATLASAVVAGLSARDGDGVARVVTAGARAVEWASGADAAVAGALAAGGALPAVCAGVRAFAGRDDILGPLAAALRALVPTAPDGSIPEGTPAYEGGGAVIAALLDVVRLSPKRGPAAPDYAVWTPLLALLDALLAASPANRAAFLRYPHLLRVLSSALDWSIGACEPEAYRAWREATRPPPSPDEAGGKHKQHGAGARGKAGGAGAGGGKKAAGAAAAAAAAAAPPAGDGGDAGGPPPEVPPQWVPARLVRYLLAYTGGGGGTEAGAELRKALVHRKVGEYVWPWVCALAEGGLSEAEVDGGGTAAFLGAVWRVGADGPYPGWEATASREEIAAVSKKFPSWKPDPAYL